MSKELDKTTFTVKDLIRQKDGRHTIVFTDGSMQPNVGVCFHGDRYDGGDVVYYNLFFEVVPDFNPIIKRETT